ncbi:DUF3040 domain-containing protein [Corynebacterium kroppenstedtii]|uniref:DUF3040 domain-containing protein n=1 Tax=Corynebacterium sp. PCR 32 TaxID=3351342 RepID=UPI0030A458AC
MRPRGGDCITPGGGGDGECCEYAEGVYGTVIAPVTLSGVENSIFAENGGVVALSEQEQRTLDEIENALYQEDPDFGKNVGSIQGGGVAVKVVALLILGLALLVGGMALSQISLWFVAMSVAGFLVMFGAGVICLRGRHVISIARANGVSGRGTKSAWSGHYSSQVKQSGGMEENFRRRFER